MVWVAPSPSGGPPCLDRRMRDGGWKSGEAGGEMASRALSLGTLVVMPP